MYCPEHKVFDSKFLWVWMYWHDVPRETIPLKVWLNPLNYQISMHFGSTGRILTINREGQWVRNKLWIIKQSFKKCTENLRKNAGV